MIDKFAFISQLEHAASNAQGVPVTGGMLRFLALELQKSDPPWWKHTAKAWDKRVFVNWAEAWEIFLAAVHYEALSDAKNQLVPYFPSCGGTDEADPSTGLAQFLKDPPQSFFDNLKGAHKRIYLAPRARFWTSLSQFFFQTRQLPFYFLQINAGAGLDMAADLFKPVKGFNPSLIEARIGLDHFPLDIHDINHRRWLTACYLPDQMPLIAEFDDASATLLKRLNKEPDFIQIFPSYPEQAPKFLAENLPAEEDVGLLVMNMATSGRMTDAEYSRYQRNMFAAMKPWGERALWIELENVRGEIYSATLELRAWRLEGPKSEPRGQVIARFDFAARTTGYNKDVVSRFLLPPGVKLPPTK
jgi:hypothetical protein